MAKRLTCPCGETTEAEDDDAFVEQVQEHVRAEHPGREYSREALLSMAR